jgi:hypothetical protein
MIIKYDNFINEFYTGKYASAGFKLSDPKDKYDFELNIKANPENDIIVKDILKKFNIAYDDVNIIPQENTELDGEKVKISFLTYNKYEAGSIVNSIVNEFIKKEIPIDINTIKLEPQVKHEKRKIGF